MSVTRQLASTSCPPFRAVARRHGGFLCQGGTAHRARIECERSDVFWTAAAQIAASRSFKFFSEQWVRPQRGWLWPPGHCFMTKAWQAATTVGALSQREPIERPLTSRLRGERQAPQQRTGLQGDGRRGQEHQRHVQGSPHPVIQSCSRRPPRPSAPSRELSCRRCSRGWSRRPVRKPVRTSNPNASSSTDSPLTSAPKRPPCPLRHTETRTRLATRCGCRRGMQSSEAAPREKD